MDADEVARRLADLERRVSHLEGRRPTPQLTGEGGGEISYHGHLQLYGEVQWRINLAAEPVLSLDDAPRVETLAALAHPARISIIRKLLTAGPQPVSALQETAGVRSTGQLYHHLKSLTAGGLVESDGRGRYRIPVEAMVPIVIMLAAASDVAGQLR